MNEYEFDLIFKLSDNREDPSIYVDDLYKNGCDDAIISHGKLGMVSLSFIRESVSAEEAIKSAIKDVKNVISDVSFVEASPDIVSMTDIAEILGHSRQNVRKIFDKNYDYPVPLPIHIGSPSIWHLSDVLTFLKDIGKIDDTSNNQLFEISNINMKVNSERRSLAL